MVHKFCYQATFFAMLITMGLVWPINFVQADNPTPGTLDLISHVGGTANAVFVQDKYAYVGIGPKLVILDMSTLTNPTPLGQIILPSSVNIIRGVGNYLYIATESNGLQVVNVANPIAPAIVSSYHTATTIAGFVMVGNYAYLTEGKEGLLVINIANPFAISEVGVYTATSFMAGHLAIKDKYAYVLGVNSAIDVANSTLYAIDISNVTAPVYRSSYEVSRNATNIAVAGNYAYVSWLGCSLPPLGCNLGGLEVVNISQPTALKQVSRYNGFGPAKSVELADKTAYLATDYLDSNSSVVAYLEVVDLSNIAQPKRYSYWQLSAKIIQLTKKDHYLYLANGSDGFRVLDSNLPMTAEICKYGQGIGLDSYKDIATTDTYALATSSSTLQILNTSSPTAPLEIFRNSYPSGSPYYYNLATSLPIAVANNYAYLGWSAKDYYYAQTGLTILNIFDPTAPNQASTNYLRSTWMGTQGGDVVLAVANNYVYVADQYTLWVVDVTTPATPIVVGVYNSPGGANRIALTNNYLYLATRDGNLQVLDISQHLTPTLISTYSTPGNVKGVAVVGNYAYLATEKGGLHIVNIANPTQLTKVGSYDTATTASDVAVANGLAYLAVKDGSLQIINIANPRAPSAVTVYTGLGDIEKVAVVGNYIYLASNTDGLYTLRFNEPAHSTLTGQVKQANGKPFANVTISTDLNEIATTGFYTFTSTYPRTFTLTPTLAGYSFVPPQRSVTIPPNTSNQDFLILPAPLSITLQPNVPQTLSYTDTQGLTSFFDFFSDTVTTTTTFRLEPVTVNDQPNLAFAAKAFDLLTSPTTNFTFAKPVSITLRYDDNDLPVKTSENQLDLYWWDGATWVKATTTCVPDSSATVDMVNNVLKLSICKPGRYALFQIRYQVFLPALSKTFPYYQLVAKHSGKCLDVWHQYLDDGNTVIQWDCHTVDNRNQAWSFVPADEGYTQMVVQHSQKCLSLAESSQTNGAKVVQWSCSGSANQLWKLVPVGDYYQIVVKHSGKCLDILGASKDNGAEAIQWDCDTTKDNQLWKLQNIP